MHLHISRDRLPDGRDLRRAARHLPRTARRWTPGLHEHAWWAVVSPGTLAVFGTGLALGVGLTAFLSPRSGPALRRDVARGARRARDRVDGSGESDKKKARKERKRERAERRAELSATS